MSHRRPAAETAHSGARVPDDVAVMGFDDIEEARFSFPSLTSIAPGREQIADTAVELLFDQITSRGTAREHVEIVADYHLQIRESTAGPAPS